MSLIFVISSFFFLAVVVININGWPRIRPHTSAVSDQISVLIPARNEEENLPGCLEAVIRQGETVAEILVYDDHSTDGTSRVIERFASIDHRVRPVDPVPLEPGWCGKNFACAQLAAAAKEKWLLFLDADARLSDGAAGGILADMNQRNLKFLSAWPGLELDSFWERTLMPVLNFVVFSIFPAPLSMVLERPSLGLAHGACLMFERDSYREIGGHGMVKDQIFEDVRLAQLWRQNGLRGLCLDGQDIVRVRMYSSFEEIWRGFQKNFFPAFRRELNFWLFIIFHFLVFLMPFLLLVYRPAKELWLAASMILLSRFALTLHFRQPLWSAFLHPISETILIILGFSSWWRCKSGQGVVWKDREYHISRR